jgi:hypothetical protein
VSGIGPSRRFAAHAVRELSGVDRTNAEGPANDANDPPRTSNALRFLTKTIKVEDQRSVRFLSGMRSARTGWKYVSSRRVTQLARPSHGVFRIVCKAVTLSGPRRHPNRVTGDRSPVGARAPNIGNRAKSRYIA